MFQDRKRRIVTMANLPLLTILTLTPLIGAVIISIRERGAK